MTQTLGPYPEQDEFDIDVFRMLTLKLTKTIKAYPQLYRFLSNKSANSVSDTSSDFLIH